MKLVFAGAMLLSFVTAGKGLAQSDVAFPAEVYARRREALAARVGDATIVIAGAYLINPGDQLVKQDPDFWYLTGVESPYAILVITPSTTRGGRPQSILFSSRFTPVCRRTVPDGRSGIPRCGMESGAATARARCSGGQGHRSECLLSPERICHALPGAHGAAIAPCGSRW
jgi:hypothetical protein